jgi:hypothetical protein
MFRKILLVIAGVVITFELGFGQNTVSIVDTIRSEFRKRNPIIQNVTLLDLVTSYQTGGVTYFVVARGIREDGNFAGSFEDELFGLFVVDATFTRVVRVVDIFPTQRWADYFVEIERPVRDSIVLLGQGGYGDVQLHRAYPMDPNQPPYNPPLVTYRFLERKHIMLDGKAWGAVDRVVFQVEELPGLGSALRTADAVATARRGEVQVYFVQAFLPGMDITGKPWLEIEYGDHAGRRGERIDSSGFKGTRWERKK